MSAKPVFIVGNKRSGTTLLVNMLNEHPQLAITHESDIIWALYQCRNGLPRRFQTYPWDAPRGLDALIDSYGMSFCELSSEPLTPAKIREAYFDIQRKVIEHGTEVHRPLKETAGVTWIGDKKPVQHASPELRHFIREVFPDAKFIHIIRHPSAVIASQYAAAQTWPIFPDYWKEAAPNVLDRWCIHEQWVLELKEMAPGLVRTVRLEDLCSNPSEEIDGLFTFLQVETPAGLTEQLSRFVYCFPNEKYVKAGALVTPEVQHILAKYGYMP